MGQGSRACFSHDERARRPEPFDPLPTRVYLFLGDDPASWQIGETAYRGVIYRDIRPGVDLVHTVEAGRLKSRLVIAPESSTRYAGSAPDGTLLETSGEAAAPGISTAKAVAVDSLGNAYVTGSLEAFAHLSPAGPATYCAPTDGYFARFSNSGTLTYLAVFGGNCHDEGRAIALDSSGAVFVAGRTNSTDFPQVGSAGKNSGAGDGFALKFDPSSQSLVYSRYLGGKSEDAAAAIAVDTRGDAYVAGRTRSVDFPTTAGAFQRTLKGTEDAFVAKFDASGNVIFSTLLGGAGSDSAAGIAVDSAFRAFVAGSTGSADFPATPGGVATSKGAGTDGFVAALNASGAGLAYSVFLGGAGEDAANAIAVDGNGNAYVAGRTTSANFPVTAGAFGRTRRGGAEAFIAALNPSATAFVYSTYLGGSGDDAAYGIAADPDGNAYVAGGTKSADFPLTGNALQHSYAGAEDAFFAAVDPTGAAVLYSTYLGGAGIDSAAGIGYGGTTAYAAGSTNSGNAVLSEPGFTHPHLDSGFRPFLRAFRNPAAPAGSSDMTAPSVSVTAPAAGATVSGTITVSASAADNIGVAGVQFYANGAPIGAEDTAAPYSVSWNTAQIANGAWAITARARDTAGNQIASVPVGVTVANVDAAPPSVSVTAPTAGATVSGAVIVSASAADNSAVAGVQFFVDGAPIGAEDTAAPYSVSWNTVQAANGARVLTARARDASGNQATSAAVSVTVSNTVEKTAPLVSITSPAAGATLSGTVTVSASASDNVGVAGVQFLLDGAPIGAEDTAAPYSVSWNTVQAANGARVLTARARDAAGNQTTSAAVSVTVSNTGEKTAPAVSITAPAAGATVSGIVTVSADASDNVGVVGVQFLVNGVPIGGEDVSAPYSVAWNSATLLNGTFTLTARARDAAGNQATSAGVSVTVSNSDSGAPSVSISSPSPGAVISGTTMIWANASDNVGVAGVQFFIDGAPFGAEDTVGPFGVVWNGQAANGVHTITARARDRAGNATTSAPVSVTVANGDATAPAVSISAPAAGATVSGTVTVSANASDNVGVAGVQFYVNGAPLGAEDTAAPYSVAWNTAPLAKGAYALTARARDAAGNQTTSAAAGVTVNNPDTTKPAVSIAAPLAGATVSGMVTVTANASDNVGVAGVQFYVNGVPLGAEDTAAPYSVAWNTAPLANGAYALTARARDAAGNQTTSAAVGVTVGNPDTTKPAVSIAAPLPGATVSGTVTVSATASDNIGVAGAQFYVNGAPLGAEDTAAPYSVAWNTATLANGAYTLTARARDAAGNQTTSAAVNVTVNNPDTIKPAASIAAPLAGATVSGTVTVSATASDNIGVAGVQFYVNGAPLGAEDTAAPYSVAWNTAPLANGAYTLTARARDAAGNQTTSAVVNVTVNNPDTTRPAVSISTPLPGATVSGTVTVSANASDNIGVAGVQFYVNGAPLGAEDTAAPYSVAWNTTSFANGTYALTARARDAAGNQTTSAAVSVTVGNISGDQTPPNVAISSPSPGAVLSGITMIWANVSDNVRVAGVQFYLNGAPLGAEDTAAPFGLVWNTDQYAKGSYTITARARDAAGNQKISTPVTVTVGP